MKPQSMKPRLSGIALGIFCVSLVPSARAVMLDDPELGVIRQQLEEQSRTLAEQQKQLAIEFQKLESHRRALQDSQRKLDSLQTQLGMPMELMPQYLSQAEQMELSGRGPGDPRTANTLNVATVFNQPSILTPKGVFVLEPSLSYAYSTSNRVSVLGFSIENAVLIGIIDVRTVQRNSWTAAIAGRYGLTPRLEIEAKIPYLYRNDDTVTRPLAPSSSNRLYAVDGKGLGDVELAARYQLNLPQGDNPFYIAGLRFKTRTGSDPFDVEYDDTTNLPMELATGSGYYSLQSSLSAVLPADPAVFFGGINYVFNMKRDVNKIIGAGVGTTTIGEVDPGDSVGINFGMGLALNEKSSLSLGYDHTWIGKTENDGVASETATSTQLANLLLGYSYRLGKKTSLSLSISAGLTDDTPDTQITVRLPIRF